MSDHDLHIALCEAVQQKSIEQMVALLEAGADPRARDAGAGIVSCPMLSAASDNFVVGLEILHRSGGDPNGIGRGDLTPLMGAAASGHVEAGRWLLRHGADPNIQGSFNKTVTDWALTSGKFEFAEMILQECPESRTDILEKSTRRLMLMANIEVAQWLLEHGVSANLMNNEGHSWLRCAQTKNDGHTKALTELLLAAGADVNLVDAAGSTPLHAAWQNQRGPALLRLLGAGADPDLRDKNGDSVRRLIEHMDANTEMAAAFKAWDSSQAAHDAIQGAMRVSVSKPL